jgi:hypothetical protein
MIAVFLFYFQLARADDFTELAKDCVHDAQDAHEPHRKFTAGSFKGRCVDASSVRPLQILSESRDKITVAGFYDQGKFWRAEIPKNSVGRVLFQIVPFASGVPLIQAAHTQFRFQLKMGKQIALTSQSGGEKSSARDVIVSSTYTAPSGADYSAVKSLGGSYGLVTRMLTAYERGKEEILKDKSTVRQFELKVSEQEMNDLLLLSLRRSHTDGYSQIYDLMTNNCTTITFELLDKMRAPPEGVEPVRGSWWNLRDEFIKPSLEGLSERGLIDEKSEISPMNTEMKY